MNPAAGKILHNRSDTVWRSSEIDHAIGASAAAGLPLNSTARSTPQWPDGVTADELARDENFWSEVAAFYDRTKGIVNLEHGYWGKMASPVQDAYLDATRMVNAQNSFYARKRYDADAAFATQRVARTLGVRDDEIVLTRNATEAVQNLIRQYRGLQDGDAVLYADIDYPHFKSAMRWLEGSRGARPAELVLPPRAGQDEIFDLYRNAFDAHPNLKLMLVTHVSNQQPATSRGSDQTTQEELPSPPRRAGDPACAHCYRGAATRYRCHRGLRPILGAPGLPAAVAGSGLGGLQFA